MEDLVLYALELALRPGVSYAEVRYHKLEGFGVITRNGEPVGVRATREEGLAVRVVVDGGLGFSSTSALSRGGVARAVEKAYRLAKSSAPLVKSRVEMGEARQGRARYEVVEARRLDDMGFEERLNYQLELWKSVVDAVSDAKVETLYTDLHHMVEEKIVATSSGAFVASRVPRLMLTYNLVLSHPQKGSLQRYMVHFGSGGAELLEKWRVHEDLPREVTSLEEVLMKGKKPPEGKVDVVVGSEVVGLVVHESCGHPCEADRILGREAAQAGKSFVKPDMLGVKIGNEHATVIDDPTIPGSAGFYLYDDEGVPARPRYLYREGVINELLHNRWTAAVFGVESNASARACSYWGEPIVRMANTYLKPGDYRFEELIEEVKRGVYIKSYMEWNIDDMRLSQRYVGLEAYEIVNGELGSPVRNPVLELTTQAFYGKIDAVGKEVRFYSGRCAKGEPVQLVPVWFGGPDVRLRGVKLGVTA